MICERCQYRFGGRTKGGAPKLQCPMCKHWHLESSGNVLTNGEIKIAQRLSDVSSASFEHIPTGPWDLVFGPANQCEPCKKKDLQPCPHQRKPNGIVRNFAYLIGGMPGAGKSTLALQINDALSGALGRDTLYVSAEETKPQIKYRFERMCLANAAHIWVVSTLETPDAIESLPSLVKELKPCGAILDSITDLCGSDMDLQVSFAKMFKQMCALENFPGFLIDHATKEDDFAGKLDLQHEVDATISFYPMDESESAPRILKTIKNRDGRAYVQVALELSDKGLSPYETEE